MLKLDQLAIQDLPTPKKPLPLLLKIEKLVKYYGGRPVVNNLSFEVKPAEIVGLLGPNGAGKTTAFYMTIGLIRPDSGNVFFKQQNATHLKLHERARLGMGYLAQEPSVFRELTVLENILCILETMPLSRKERQESAEKLLSDLHLEHLMGKKAGTLSGGERRRLEISRALATQPSLLLLDEPFANIDPIAINDVKQLMLLLKKKGISILITDHNAREIFSIVDRSYLMRDGNVLLSGTVDELLRSKEARSSYLGEDFRL